MMALLLISLLFLTLAFFLLKTNSRKSGQPPSPAKLPIIGNLHQLGTLPHHSLRALSLKHGPLMLLHLGATPHYVVSSADMVREVMKTHDAVFSDRPSFIIANRLLYGCKDVAFARYGEYWRQDNFAAGSDTTPTLMHWTMAELIRHPNAMKKVQDEVRKLVKGRSKVTEDDLHEMQYLKEVIKETARLHPPFPLLLPRQTTHNVKLQGYQIPAKSKVIVNAWAIGRDPKWWEDPEEFRPERFMNKSIDFKGHDYQLIPFGAGRRGCPGIPFAMPMIELALANLLNGFDWHLPGGVRGEEIDMAESFGLSVRKTFPLIVTARPHF